jgi:hypothetical protein
LDSQHDDDDQSSSLSCHWRWSCGSSESRDKREEEAIEEGINHQHLVKLLSNMDTRLAMALAAAAWLSHPSTCQNRNRGRSSRRRERQKTTVWHSRGVKIGQQRRRREGKGTEGKGREGKGGEVNLVAKPLSHSRT